jgi:hypothetical protein
MLRSVFLDRRSSDLDPDEEVTNAVLALNSSVCP